MAFRGTGETVFGTPKGTFWEHSERFLGEGGARGVLLALSLTAMCRITDTATDRG